MAALTRTSLRRPSLTDQSQFLRVMIRPTRPLKRPSMECILSLLMMPPQWPTIVCRRFAQRRCETFTTREARPFTSPVVESRSSKVVVARGERLSSRQRKLKTLSARTTITTRRTAFAVRHLICKVCPRLSMRFLPVFQLIKRMTKL